MLFYIISHFILKILVFVYIFAKLLMVTSEYIYILKSHKIKI